MKSKKLVVLILAFLVFAFMLTSCQPASTTKTAANGSQASGATTGTGGATDSNGKDPVKISVGSTSQLQTAPINWYETDTFKEVTKLANVEIEYMYYDQDKFNLMLAGDSMPDLTFGYYPTKLPDIIEGKLALDIYPYVDQYPEIDSAPYKQRNTIISNFYGGDEKALYFIGDYVGLELRDGGVVNYRGYNMRWDWYKEIGAPHIATPADYLTALEAMVAAHPKTEDGKKVYATGLAGSTFSPWYTNGCFCEPSMTNMWTFGEYLYMEAFADGTLINGYTDLERSPYWSDMRFYNTLFNKGLLDPDSFTMTNEERQAKSANGQYAAEMGWPADDLYNAEVAKDPNTLAGIISIPNEASLVFADYKQVCGYFPSYYIFVSSKSNAVDGALSFLNVLHDPEVERMMYSGFEGVHWNVVDGVPTPTDEVLNLRISGGDDWLRTGIENTGVFGMLQGSFLAADGYPVNLFDTDDMRKAGLNPLRKDFADYYEVDYPSQASMKLVNEGKAVSMANCFSELNQSATETMPTDIQRILTQCNDILFEAVPLLVQAKTDSDFATVQEKVLADLAATREAEAWEWCLEANTKAQAFTKPLTSALDW